MFELFMHFLRGFIVVCGFLLMTTLVGTFALMFDLSFMSAFVVLFSVAAVSVVIGKALEGKFLVD